MRIHKLTLKHYKALKDLEIIFDKQLTIIVGKNGAGKSSVLQSVEHCMSWIIARIKNPKGQGKFISDQDITNGEPYARITAEFDDINELTVISKHRSLVKGSRQSANYESLNTYVDQFHQSSSTEHDANLPLFVSYGVKRAVVDVPLRIRRRKINPADELYDKWSGGSANFRSFFEWFRNESDIENERRLQQHTLPAGTAPDRELSTVRRALAEFMPSYNNIRVQRRPLRMLVDKNNQPFSIEQLSDGERIYIALIGDLCRRLVLANPQLEDPLQGGGIVLIDELDLHLHPTWQTDIAPNLVRVFPHIQFITTTHSPLVLANVSNDRIRILHHEDSNTTIEEALNSYGIPSDAIMADIMGLQYENKKIELLLQAIYDHIDSKNEQEAMNSYNELVKAAPRHPELSRIWKFIERLQRA